MILIYIWERVVTRVRCLEEQNDDKTYNHIHALAVVFCGGIQAQVEFKRGLEQISFIPKGQWITG